MARAQVYGKPASHVVALWRQQAKKAVVVVGGAVLLALSATALFGAGGLMFGAVAALLAVAWVQVDIRPKLGRLSAGLNAERKVGRMLERCGAIVVLHGLDIDGRGGDADHTVVGPVLAVVETKHGHGKVHVTGDGTVKVGRKTLSRSPLEQVRRQARKVSHVAGITATPVLCVADATSKPFQRDGVWVCGVDQLGPVLAALPRLFSPEQAQQLAARMWDNRFDRDR